MDRKQITAGLQGIFNEIFIEPVQLRDDLTANDVEEWDSLLHITLVVAIEKRFGIRFAVGEVEATQNVGEFIDLIAKQMHVHEG